MKKIFLFSVIALFLSAMGSCEKDECKKNIKESELGVRNFSYTQPKQYVSNAIHIIEKEYLELKVKGHFLSIRHINSALNSCPKQISVTSKLSNDTIYINETQSKECLRIGNYDLRYEVGKLDYRKYHIVLTKFNSSFPITVFKLDFNANTNKIVNINPQKAVIVYTGKPNKDGCDYLIKIDETFYKPTFLPLEFCYQNLKVKLQYQLLKKKWTCKKDRKTYTQIDILKIEEDVDNYPIYEHIGTIIDKGDPSLDGCGYFIKINKVLYKPINLPKEYCHKGLKVKVKVKYNILQKKGFNCHWDIKKYNQIKIIKITKQ